MSGAFRLPTRTVLESGSFRQLGEIAALFAPGVALVVTDEGVSGTGIPRAACRMLAESGLRPWVEIDVVPNPRVADVDAMAAAARREHPVVVVAIGGGSVIDAAKGVALMLRNHGSCRDYRGLNRFPEAAAPLIAVPTTCGTGSEVTWVSVLTDEQSREKISVKGDGLFPAFAIVDADLLKTLPAHLVASTGMDALTHAVEAFIGSCANPVSDELAVAAIRLLLGHLADAVADIGGADAAREGVMHASTLAGMAFGNADVGGVHCLSESIGGRHDLPHGLLNAVLLVPVLRYHEKAAARRFAELSRRLGAENVIATIEALGRTVGIPAFPALDVPHADYPAIARAAEANGSNASNPQEMTAADYMAILEGLGS